MPDTTGPVPPASHSPSSPARAKWLGALLILLLCSIVPGSTVPVSHGSRAQPFVALTFDACQTRKPAGYDAEIVRVLQQTRTAATFFLGGRWMETHAEITKQLAQDPLFELGNHSYSHPHLTRLTEKQVRAELEKTQAILLRLTGRQGRLFRAPYGEYDARVLRVAAALGLVTVQWDVISGDPDRRVTADRMVEAVVRQCRNGSIIIMHVNGRGWHTAEALPEIIGRLTKAGYRFVTVSQLLAGEPSQGVSPPSVRREESAPPRGNPQQTATTVADKSQWTSTAQSSMWSSLLTATSSA